MVWHPYLAANYSSIIGDSLPGIDCRPYLALWTSAVSVNAPHVTSVVRALLMSNVLGLIAATKPTMTAGIPERDKQYNIGWS